MNEEPLNEGSLQLANNRHYKTSTNKLVDLCVCLLAQHLGNDNIFHSLKA